MKKRMIAFRLPESLLGEMKAVAKEDDTTMTNLVQEGVIKELLIRKFEKTKGSSEELKKYVDRISSVGIEFALSTLLSSFFSSSSFSSFSFSPSPKGEGEILPPNVYTKPTKNKFAKAYVEALKTKTPPKLFNEGILYGKYLMIRKEATGSYGVSRIDHDLEMIKFMLKEYPNWFSEDLEDSSIAPSEIVDRVFNNMASLKPKITLSLDAFRNRNIVSQWGLDKNIFLPEHIDDPDNEEWGD